MPHKRSAKALARRGERRELFKSGDLPLRLESRNPEFDDRGTVSIATSQSYVPSEAEQEYENSEAEREAELELQQAVDRQEEEERLRSLERQRDGERQSPIRGGEVDREEHREGRQLRREERGLRPLQVEPLHSNRSSGSRAEGDARASRTEGGGAVRPRTPERRAAGKSEGSVRRPRSPVQEHGDGLRPTSRRRKRVRGMASPVPKVSASEQRSSSESATSPAVHLDRPKSEPRRVETPGEGLREHHRRQGERCDKAIGLHERGRTSGDEAAPPVERREVHRQRRHSERDRAVRGHEGGERRDRRRRGRSPPEEGQRQGQGEGPTDEVGQERKRRRKERKER